MSSPSDYKRLMRGVIPYVTVEGADKAIEFYTRAFGAVLRGEVARSEDGRVLNASIEINDGMVMMMDPFPDHGSAPSSGSNFLLQLVIADGDLWWDRAVGAGCEVLSPLKLEFWGDRFGRVHDPFGLEWAFNEPAIEKQRAG
ncbi:VOC family protein [Hoeflea ulvae]|uniref:VOC family protein n=1 Tax=Hoeflea ulvae TaxID=2983764 RepID=A0ABT3YFB7_9HYPH|nr:VOC family protein [Hoeflea ulvae]MCY0094551.1 VOC family protein [Hoeflea ulvae]